MKKLFTLVLILCLVLPCAFAENVKDLTDEELKALYIEVKAELMERKLWDTGILPAGIYVGGMNLPEGNYELTVNSDCIVAAWNSFEECQQDSGALMNCIYGAFLEAGSVLTMTLTNGMCWSIQSDSIVRPFTGIVW